MIMKKNPRRAGLRIAIALTTLFVLVCGIGVTSSQPTLTHGTGQQTKSLADFPPAGPNCRRPSKVGFPVTNLRSRGCQAVFTVCETSITEWGPQASLFNLHACESFNEEERGKAGMSVCCDPKPCNPKDYWSDYKRESDTANDLFKAASDHSKSADKEYHDWKVEEAKTMAEISAEKYDLLQTVELALEEGGKHILHGAVWWFGMATTAAWIYTDVYPHVRDHNQAMRDAGKMSGAGTDLALKALDSLIKDGEQEKACAEQWKQDQQRVIEQEKILDAAKKLREEWNQQGGDLYKDPNDPSGYPMNAAAALKRATGIITKSQGQESPSALRLDLRNGTLRRAAMKLNHLLQQPQITVTVEQTRAALAEVNSAIGMMEAGRRTMERQKIFEDRWAKELQALIDRHRQTMMSMTAPASSSTSSSSPNSLRNRPNNATNSSAASRIVTAKANTYFNQKRYAEAAEAYREALRLNPNDAQAQNGLGSAYYKMSKYEEAIEAFKLGLRLNPNEAVAHSRLGAAYGELGRYEEAVAPLKEAIRLDPKDYITHYNLGQVYLHLGDRNSALSLYRILKVHRPDLARMLYRDINQ